MRYLTGTEEEKAIHYMKEAGKSAEKALCIRAKCGTVIVSDEDIVIGLGYNAPALDRKENRMCEDEFVLGKPKYDKTCCIHAEWRAIMDALARNPDKIKGSKLYFTRVDDNGELVRSGKPFCTVCSRLALDTGIAFFVLWDDQGVCEYATDEYNRLSYQFIH